MRRSLAKLAERGGSDREEVLARVEEVETLPAADLMIEAVVEDVAVEEDVFCRAAALLPAEAILASNTSSIPITSLAAVTGRPERVIGMHFSKPVAVPVLVGGDPRPSDPDETAEASSARAGAGKTPAQDDFPGFVSNRILVPFINEAVYALMEDVAEADAIDTIAASYEYA